MCFPASRFHLPDRRRWLPGLALFLVTAGAVNGLVVRGNSTGGLSFAGNFMRISKDTLTIREERNGQTLQIGIPLAGLKSLSISLPGKPVEKINRDLESLLPILSLLDEPSLRSLIQYLECRADAGEWTDTCLWAQRLEAIAREDGPRRRIGLLKARSLHALGLFRLLEEELGKLASLFPPANAPPVYCWLRAVQSARRDQIREARFWARLPFLTIPVPREPVMQELALLATQLEKRLDPQF